MKRKYIWLIEFFVWFFIIVGVMGLFVVQTKIKDNKHPTYYIFVDDASGIVKGSPVRLMGITIGYVNNIKIIDNKVFVSFIVNKEDVQLPVSSTAMITFYGLGGSNSIELMPDISINKSEQEVIVPVDACRVKDFWDGQALVSNVLIDIYGGIGRTIQSADLIDNKNLIKQSSLVKNLSNQAVSVNTAQTVIISKLTQELKNKIESGTINE